MGPSSQSLPPKKIWHFVYLVLYWNAHLSRAHIWVWRWGARIKTLAPDYRERKVSIKKCRWALLPLASSEPQCVALVWHGLVCSMCHIININLVSACVIMFHHDVSNRYCLAPHIQLFGQRFEDRFIPRCFRQKSKYHGFLKTSQCSFDYL